MDSLFLTKTWLRNTLDHKIALAGPTYFKIIYVNQQTRLGGGFAIMFKESHALLKLMLDMFSLAWDQWHDHLDKPPYLLPYAADFIVLLALQSFKILIVGHFDL